MSTEYTNYIVTHVENVKKAYNWLKDHKIISEELTSQIDSHDLSKYSAEEYEAYDNYFYGKRFSGDKNGHAKAVLCVELNKIYTTVKEASKCSGTSRQNISHVLNGRQETAGGYHWEYV